MRQAGSDLFHLRVNQNNGACLKVWTSSEIESAMSGILRLVLLLSSLVDICGETNTRKYKTSIYRKMREKEIETITKKSKVYSPTHWK